MAERQPLACLGKRARIWLMLPAFDPEWMPRPNSNEILKTHASKR